MLLRHLLFLYPLFRRRVVHEIPQLQESAVEHLCKSTSCNNLWSKFGRNSWQTAPVRRGGKKSGSRSLSPAPPAWKLQVETLSIFRNHQEVVARKPSFRRPMFVYYFVVLWRRFAVCRFGRAFFVHIVYICIITYSSASYLAVDLVWICLRGRSRSGPIMLLTVFVWWLYRWFLNRWCD